MGRTREPVSDAASVAQDDAVAGPSVVDVEVVDVVVVTVRCRFSSIARPTRAAPVTTPPTWSPRRSNDRRLIGVDGSTSRRYP